jgi:RNA recognition motif-containing protein
MNIYVANLSYDVNDADLKELFDEYGQVSSAKVIMDRMSGRSRGFGFVEMDDNGQGQKAIDELNQCEYDGKVISVNLAKPRTDRREGGYFGGRNNSGDNDSRRNSRY